MPFVIVIKKIVVQVLFSVGDHAGLLVLLLADLLTKINSIY